MSAVDTLVSVVVGAIIGFFGSIGFDRWKERGQKKELRDRIREELEITLQEVTSDYEREAFQSRAFFMEAWYALKQDLIRKLDAKTFRAILETYIKIESLRFPSNTQDLNRSKYREAIDGIEKTVELLK